MAYGRMISKKISLSKEVNSITNDASKLAFTWTIAHLDRDGRIIAEPNVLKNIVFPWRNDISEKEFDGYIKDWAIKGFITLYEKDGCKYLQYNNFRKNQKKLRYEQEAESNYPDPEDSNVIKTFSKRCRNVSKTAQCNLINKKIINKNINGDESPKNDKELSVNQDKKLHNNIKAVFESKHGNFDDYPKEGQNINRLIEKAKARAPDCPDDFMKAVLNAFWKLKQNGNDFWKGQPFLPSILNSSGIWPRVLESMRTEEIPEPEEVEF